jgi:hypothetical protein
MAYSIIAQFKIGRICIYCSILDIILAIYVVYMELPVEKTRKQKEIEKRWTI